LLRNQMVLVEDLHVKYGNLEVLKGITFSVNYGEKVVVLGPSGSGKSTLLKSLILLVKPWKGRIFIGGEEVTDPKTNIVKIRQKVGMVFQNYNLFPHLTILRNITLPLEKVKKMSKEEAEKKAWEVLKLVGLEDKAHSYPLQLSGGQQQRAAIARAMAMDPKLLLLDEPTSALDPELVEEVLEVLRTIASKSLITMIIVTHELDFAEDVADRVLFIDKGVIVEEGNVKKVLHDPVNPRTRHFIRRLLRRKGLLKVTL